MRSPEDSNLAELLFEKRKLEQLVHAHERTVQEQSQKLSEALTELQERAKEIENSQDALAHQTLVLESIIKSIIAGVVVSNVDGCLTLFNPVAEEILGLGLTEAPLEEWTQRYGCYLADKVTPFPVEELPLARALRGETIYDAQVFIRNSHRPKGVMLSVNASPYRDQDGKILGGVAVFYDVTERTRIGDALRKSERRFADLFLGAADPIVILDASGKIQNVNPAAERVSGCTLSELEGKIFTEVGVIAPSSLPKAVQEFTRVTLGEDVLPYELEIMTRSGNRLIFEAHAKLLNHNDESAGVQVIFRDITDRKYSEKRSAIQYAVTSVLAESSSKEETISRVMQAIGESLHWEFGAMWEVDFGSLKSVQIWHDARFYPGHFAAATQATRLSSGIGIAGKAWQTNQAQWIEDVSEDANFPRLPAALADGLKSGFCFPVRAGGKVVGIMEFYCFVVRKSDPHLLQMFDSIGTQIGQFLERRQTEQALTQKQVELAKSHAEVEQLEIFAYVASHDLQEPLQKILAYTEFLKEEKDMVCEKSRQYLDKLEQASVRMSHLIADLLKFIKVSSKENIVERVNLYLVAKDVLNYFEEEIQKAGARVELGPLPVLKADTRQMQQLFQNLISNALKFRKKDEPLHLIISSRDAGQGYVEILVEDNGVGFDERHGDRLFRPFERLHGREEYKGSGIGLAICRKIVERHRGTITARSGVGKGTVFFVRLPMA